MTVNLMYPGSTFDYYIPDDLLNGVEKDSQGEATLDKDKLPRYQIVVLTHRQTIEMLNQVDRIGKLQKEVDAGDHLKEEDIADIQVMLIKKYVRGCENFPKTAADPERKFDVEKVEDTLNSRQIAWLAKGVTDQRPNDDLDLKNKKKLSSPSGSGTEDAPDEAAPDTEDAQTGQA